MTLDLSAPEIPAEKFADGVRAFLDLINEVANTVSGKPRTVRWIVSVRPGSALVDFEPRAEKISERELSGIVTTVEGGIVALEAGLSQPPKFSNRAVDHMGRLASILDGRKRDLDHLRVWRGHIRHDVTLQTVANVDALSGIDARDWGTIEGELVTISGAHGLQFAVRDEVTKRSTRCYFGEDIVEDVAGAFLRRVSVSGIIRYRRDGEPVSIKVDEFTILPRREELPDFEDVRGILRGAT